jgi:hypothetical protein
VVYRYKTIIGRRLRARTMQTADRGKDWLQRAQSDDISRHAGLGSTPLILDPVGQVLPPAYSCTKAP